MSGLVAVCHADGRHADPALVPSMLAAIAYRGGNRTGGWSGAGCALGIAQRTVLAEDVGVDQPFASDNGPVRAVLDGFFANAAELRRALSQAGVRPRGASDVELAVLAFRTWGETFVTRLDGEFALILWDERERVLFAARDPVGARPLAWHADAGGLLLASDPAGILPALARPPDIDDACVVQTITDTAYCAETTLWSGIRRLPPAHLLRWQAGRPRITRYWEPNLDKRIVHRTDVEYEAHYRAMLADCVARYSRSDSPAAYHVSGGLDSTAVFCMAHRLLAEGRLPAPDIVGITLQGPPGSHADEIRYVEAVEAFTGRSVIRAPLTMPPLAFYAAQARDLRDVPCMPNSVMAMGQAELAVAAGCKVHLNGLGGDNWLEGQPLYYGEDLAAVEFGHVLSGLRSDVAEIGARETALRFSRSFAARFLSDGAHARLKSVFGQPNQPDSVNENIIGAESRAILDDLRARRTADLARYPRHNRYKIAKLTSPAFQLAFRETDKMTHLWGAEARFPMFSKQFIEFSMATPERLRQRGDQSKLIHRSAMRGILPPAIVERRSKAAFSLTFTRLFPEIHDLAFAPWPSVLTRTVLEPSLFAQALEKWLEIDEPPIFPVWGLGAAFLAVSENIIQSRAFPASNPVSK